MKNCYKKGDIVLVKFPFTSMTDFKVRPALAIRDQDGEDVTFLPISTTVNLKKHDLVIKDSQFKDDPLPVKSAIRIGKICTIHKSLALKKVSSLKMEFMKAVQLNLFRYLS